MKKYISVFLSAILVLSLFTMSICNVSAATNSQGVEFSLSGDQTHYIVTGYSGIPSQFNGKPVAKIGESAFEDCTTLTSVSIPDSVTHIGPYSFTNCAAIKNITIPNSVVEIGECAFYLSGLTSISIPASVTSISDTAFLRCFAVTSITVANGNTVYHSDGDCLIETNSKTLILGCKNSIIPSDGSVTKIGKTALYKNS